MAQTLLRKRPYREVRPAPEVAAAPFEEPQSRKRLNQEGASSIKFKSTKQAVDRVQSIFDNIVDLLANLEKLDRANPKGVSTEDKIQVRSYKNELTNYIEKFKESNFSFDSQVQKAELTTYCEKCTALIECLLPPLPSASNYLKQAVKVPKLSKQEEQKARCDYAFAQSTENSFKMQTAFRPRESPLLEHIKAIKYVTIKIAVQKLSALADKVTEANQENQHEQEVGVPAPIQTLFQSLIDSVKPYLKNNETRKKEPLKVEPQTSMQMSRQASEVVQPGASNIVSSSMLNPLTLSERAKSVSQASSGLKQQVVPGAEKTENEASNMTSPQARMAERERMEAKLWLSLYFLKKFGIKKLLMDAKVGKNAHSKAMENEDQLFTLIKQVLRSNPLERSSTGVRRLAVKVLMQEPVDLTKALNITNQLLNDQDFKVRQVYIQLMRKNLPKLYPSNPSHFDSICTQEQVLQEKNFQVKKLILELMVQRCIHLASDPSQLAASNEAANDLVRVICKEIRAMHKEMRIFCAGLLTQIDLCVPTGTVIQMMQKERMFEQKFTQVGATSTTNFAANPTTSASLQSKNDLTKQGGPTHQPCSIQMAQSTAQGSGQSALQNIEQSPQVTGILLLMLEDDSMAVRLAGIKAMSCFGKVCSDIRSKCLNFLIDMLNDEINEVRIAALHGIQRFNKVLTLNDYEVEIVLFNLNEDNPRLREEIYLFFGETTVGQGALFTKILNKLFDNLQKFEHQEDTEKIFSLVQKLGKSHSKLVSSIYLKTLNIDKRYLAKEPDQTDIVYVAKMILIYAAAEQMPRILEEAPKFFGKHLNYLKDKHPNYFYRQQDSAVAKGEQRIEFSSNLVARAHTQMVGNMKQCLSQSGYRSQGLQKLLVWTRNSFRQVLRALTSEIQATNDPQSSSGRFLEEIRQNQTDQELGFVFLWTKFVHLAQVSDKTAPQISTALQSRLQIVSHFTRIPASFSLIMRVFSLRLYTEMLALKLSLAKDCGFNSVSFLQACSLLLKLYKQQLNSLSATSSSGQTVAQAAQNEPKGEKTARSNTALNLKASATESLAQIERFIEVTLIGNQSDLKFREKRLAMACQLQQMVTKVGYADMFASDEIAQVLCQQLGQVSFRRIVISSPRDNTNEAFRFSSRHSEFVKLKAEALIVTATGEDQQQSSEDDYRRYKVVLVYPNKLSSYSMLQVKDVNQLSGGGDTGAEVQRVCRVEQFIELMQDHGWSEAANIEIFITQDFPQAETQIMVNLGFSDALLGSSLRFLKDENGHATGVIPVSNVKKYFIRPV